MLASRPAWLLGLPNAYLVQGWQAQVAPLPTPALEALEGQGLGVVALRFLRQGSASVLPCPQSSPPGPRATYQAGTALSITPCCLQLSPLTAQPALRPLPLAASRAIGGEELRTEDQGAQALCSLRQEGLRMHSLVL